MLGSVNTVFIIGAEHFLPLLGYIWAYQLLGTRLEVGRQRTSTLGHHMPSGERNSAIHVLLKSNCLFTHKPVGDTLIR